MTNYSAQGIVVVKRRSKDAVTILSTSVMYAISSSGVNAPDSGWSVNVLQTTPSQPWLWTRTTITYSEGNPSVVYTVSRQGTDGTNGTSFTPKGVALGHYSGMKSLLASVSKFEMGDTYILDMCSDGGSVNQSIPNPCVVVYMDALDYTWYATASDEGDGYNVNGTLYVNSDGEWVDFGDIQGPAGEAGEGALVAEVNPNPLTFQTNDKGAIENTMAAFYLKVYCGSLNVTKQCKYELMTDSTSYSNTEQPSKSLVNNWGYNQTYDRQTYLLVSTMIKTDPVSVENDGTTQTYNVARTAGYFTIKCIYGDRVCYAKVQFSVSISAFFQSYIRNDHYMKSQYKELESNQSGMKKEYTSLVQQTAQKITAQIEVVQGDVNKKAGLDIAVTHGEDGVIDTNVTLNADMINIDAQHSIDITSDGCFTVNSTNFKLDGYGNMTCTNGNFSGTVNATAGTIGGFRINENFIGSQSGYNMYLTNDRLHFGIAASLFGNDGCLVDIGEGNNSTGVTNAITVRSVTGSEHKVNVGGFFSVAANTTDANYCAALELQSGWATGAGAIDETNPMSGNHAILIHSGDVPGLRPSFVRVNKSKTLNSYNHTIDCYNTDAEITLSLPDSPIFGQHYVIIQEGRKVYVNGRGKKIHDYKNGSIVNMWDSDTIGQVSNLWYNGNEWIVSWFN